jgi:hypothetical protein
MNENYTSYNITLVFSRPGPLNRLYYRLSHGGKRWEVPKEYHIDFVFIGGHDLPIFGDHVLRFLKSVRAGLRRL